MYKNVNTVSNGFSARQSTPSLSMTSLSLVGVYCARSLLGRRVCKHVDVCIITLSCSWQIYALSERLLVLTPDIVFFIDILLYFLHVYYFCVKVLGGGGLHFVHEYCIVGELLF